MCELLFSVCRKGEAEFAEEKPEGEAAEGGEAAGDDSAEPAEPEKVRSPAIKAPFSHQNPCSAQPSQPPPGCTMCAVTYLLLNVPMWGALVWPFVEQLDGWLQEEMTLEEYEKLREEKRANLNKKPAAVEVKADPKDFEGMTAYVRKSNEPENDLELTTKKTIGNRKGGLVEKTRKEVSPFLLRTEQSLDWPHKRPMHEIECPVSQCGSLGAS